MTGQVALDFAQEELHGHLTVWFSRGKTPVSCTIMVASGDWYDAEGDTLPEAVQAAIDKSGSAQLVEAWRKVMK